MDAREKGFNPDAAAYITYHRSDARGRWRLVDLGRLDTGTGVARDAMNDADHS
jgi:hypothetical protein